VQSEFSHMVLTHEHGFIQIQKSAGIKIQLYLKMRTAV